MYTQLARKELICEADEASVIDADCDVEWEEHT